MMVIQTMLTRLTAGCTGIPSPMVENLSGFIDSGTLRMRIVLALLALALIALSLPVAEADEPEMKELEKAYATEIRPLVARYCQKCHSEERTEAEIDLASLATWADVRKHAATWQKAGEMLESGQMPPKASRQPT